MKCLRFYSHRPAEGGFALVEVLLAAVIFSLLATGLVGAIAYGQQSTATSGNRARATELADEGLQVVRNIRDASYSNLAAGTYGLAQSGNVWTLSGSSDTTGIFTRQLVVASAGANRQVVPSTVSWTQASGTATQVSATTELTNWAANLKSWLNAILAGTYQPAGTQSGLKVATAGNYAYVVRSGGTPNFFVVNISNPTSPTLAGSANVGANPTNIFVSGSYAYISDSADTGELQIVNISNPAIPVLTSTYDAAGNANANSVFVSGNYAYLVRAANGGSSEFVIVDISNPAAPTLVGSYGNNITMTDVYISGSYAFVGTSSTTQGLLVLYIGIPSLPLLTTSYTLSPTSAVTSMVASGTNLLITQGSTLTAYNISNPSAVSKTGSVTSSSSAAINDITVDPTNSYAFLATSSTTVPFQVVNISSLTSMSVVKTVALGTANNLQGVAYNTSLDVVVGVGNSTTQEVATFTKN